MESRYKYLYDEQAVHVAFMGAVQAYTTMFTRGVLSSETTMSNLSDELKAAQQRLNELHAVREQISAQDAQQIEGSCEGCMHIDCERDERPCSECCRLDRADRYEEEDETLADVFPELHGKV